MAVTFLTDADRAELERMISEHTGGAVTIESILMSTEDGGENIVTFSDGSRLVVTNGHTGKTGMPGPEGPAGPVTMITAESIISALGYTPANSETITELEARITALENN